MTDSPSSQFPSLRERERAPQRESAAPALVSRTVTAAAPAQLARTGSQTADVAFYGTVLLAGGVLLVLAGRQRRAAHRA